MDIKLKLKRHESFSIREGWLAKGIKNVKENSKTFSSAEATDILGIGTNMVKSLKYWMSAACLINEENRETFLSEFGNLIYIYDPYLEDIFCWWLIHIRMMLNIDDAYIYNLFFNKCGKKSFSKRDIYEQLALNLRNEKLEYNEKVYDEAIVIISGDINEDGLVNVTDQAMMTSHIIGSEEIEDYRIYAMDLDDSESINVTDQVGLINYIIGH